MKSRKSAGKTQGGARIKRPEEKASFISWRFALLCGGIGLALAALLIRSRIYRLSTRHAGQRGRYALAARPEIPTARGMISDRMGRPLAVSVPVNAVWADPKELADKGGVGDDTRWRALSEALNIPLEQVKSKVTANPKGRFVYLARQVNPTIGDYVKN